MEPIAFQATVQGSSGGPVEVPVDVPAVFGRARAPVLVTVNGHTYRSTVFVRGGEYFLPLNKANAAAAGVEGGEPFTVTVEPDERPRTVDVPSDLAEALQAHGVRDRWEALSYTRRRELASAVEDTKRPETRQRRIERVVGYLTGTRTG